MYSNIIMAEEPGCCSQITKTDTKPGQTRDTLMSLRSTEVCVSVNYISAVCTFFLQRRELLTVAAIITVAG